MKQKISYIASISYWYDSIKRFLYMISPILFVLFGITALDASPIELLLIWLPTYVINRYTIKLLSGNRRTVHWTNIYETIMFPLLMKDVLLEMVGISATVFAVTNKDGAKEDTRYQYKMAVPHIILALGTMISIVYSIGFMFETGSVTILFLVFWLVINLYNLTIAIFFMIGRRSHRKYERFQIEIPCKLTYENQKMDAITYDVSEGGCSVVVKKPIFIPPNKAVFIQLSTEKYNASFEATLVQVFEVTEGYRYSFVITKIEESSYQELLQILHDRVPPLTQYVNVEHGVLGDLHVNIEKRREKQSDFQRKLPRIYLNYELYVDSLQMTMTSFNYGYVTLKSNCELPKELSITIQKVQIKLAFVKVQNEEHLYRILNQEDIIYNNNLLEDLVKNKNQKQQKQTMSRNREKREIEFDEMEYV